MSQKISAWLYAFRLRTLPLAFSSIITGSSVALRDNFDNFNYLVFALCIVTTLFLQILSNLANDYGDSEKGTDNADRIGPVRAVQSGLLSFSEIKMGIVVNILLCLFFGVWLVVEATRGLSLGLPLFFIALGIAAIAAAIKYTVGKNAYGYNGLGDEFVMLFFGLVGVCGSYFLMSHQLKISMLLPALSIGAFASGVLNLNNMRDHISDAAANKNTLVVKWGLTKAKQYHGLLIYLGFIGAIVFTLLNFHSSFQLLFIVTVPLFRKQLAQVIRITEPKDFDPFLKQLAISTFFFAILFAVGYVIGE
jgi:1,4-dihydroxy-2-naphthoate octaprenyltransferase